MSDALVDRLASELRAARAELPSPSMVLFSAPAVDAHAGDTREALALDIAARAGLRPWPDWAVVRHGPGLGVHLLNVVHDLGRTGRASGVVVCALAPIAPSLVAQAGVVAARGNLAFAVVGDLEP
jgi:hypothetical protein